MLTAQTTLVLLSCLIFLHLPILDREHALGVSISKHCLLLAAVAVSVLVNNCIYINKKSLYCTLSYPNIDLRSLCDLQRLRVAVSDDILYDSFIFHEKFFNVLVIEFQSI